MGKLKHGIALLVCLTLSFWAAGQSYLASNLNAKLEPFFSKVGPNAGNEKAFLRKIFHKTQRAFLKRYVAYSELPELFSSGNYDCLTATTLFSSVLDHFNYRYSLIETNYHIFLIVHTSEGDVLFETTDRFNGFVTAPEKIQERTGTYAQNLIASGANVYRYQFNLYREISCTELDGLLSFNQAIKAYNNRQFEKCADLIEIASKTYSSPRVGELASILLKTVTLTESSAAARQKIISRLQPWARSIAGL